MIGVRKGEIRALIGSENCLDEKFKEFDAVKIKYSSGVDTYFNKELFLKGYQFRVRKQKIFYPHKKIENLIHLKDHEPDYRKMNVYTTYTLCVDNSDKAIKICFKRWIKIRYLLKNGQIVSNMI